MSKIIAIDLGSTLSEVSVIEAGTPTIIVNEEGSRTTPSIISFVNDERKVGSSAKRQMIMNPKETVVLIKRFMGCTYDEVKEDMKHVLYDVVNENGYPRIVIKDKKYTPEELSAMIISKMKETAENYLGETVKDAIITVPAYFNDAQRQATKRAGEIAGLNVLRIIAEPTAALLAAKVKKDGKYMVVDYGGATLDFSVADVTTEDEQLIEILASNGDVYCGGSDIDKIVTNHLISDFNKNHAGFDISKDNMAMSRLQEAAEKAKVELSNASMTDINLPYITAIDGAPVHYTATLSRAKFESLIEKEIDKVIDKGKEALKRANVKPNELNGILLVGGSTRIPYVQERLIKEFGVELIKSINPDEAVSLGAAIQGGVLAGDVKDVILLDVTPLDLGIDTMGGIMAKLVDANTTIPITKSQIFTTASDNQPAVDIVVVQGNRPMSKDNKIIGKFQLNGIAPAPRGIPQIEVSFNIDVNGILTVKAIDKATNKEQEITISNNGGLSKEDIERMKQEAEQYKAEDEANKSKIEFIHQSEMVLFNAEKTINNEELKDKITDEDREKINPIIEEGKALFEKRDYDEIKSFMDKFNEAWSGIVTKLYPNQTNDATSSNPFGNFDSTNPFNGFNGFNGFGSTK
jgi:molecular chaperone DnaK